MPVRDKFPAEYFATNPLKGEGPHGAYRRIQWGNEPQNTYRIEAPEPMATLGRLAKVFHVGGGKNEFRDWEYYVAVGTRTNRVYFVPIQAGGSKPLSFPKDFYQALIEVGEVKRTDYYSEKGGEPGYYYHDHEKPYPMLCGVDGHFVLIPAVHRGARSYAVNDEGIIG